MAAYTSSQSGNWSSAATWGGAGVPGAGDTATINGANVVTIQAEETITVGADGATGTIAVTFSGTGAGKLDVYGALILRGDLIGVGSAGRSIEFHPGSSLVFDPSATGIRYGMLGGNGGAFLFKFSGIGWGAGEYVRVYTDKTRAGASALNGFLGNVTGSTYLYALWDISYTRMDDIGDAAKYACAQYSYSTSNTFTIRNLVMNNCGAFKIDAMKANASALDVDGLHIRNPVVYAGTGEVDMILIAIASVASATPRQYKNISIYNPSATQKALLKMSDGLVNADAWYLYNTFFYSGMKFGNTSSVLNRIFFIADNGWGGQYGPQTFGTVSNSILQFNYTNTRSGTAGIWDTNIFANETVTVNDGGDVFSSVNDGKFRYNFFLPDAGAAHLSSTITTGGQEVYNNTFVGSGGSVVQNVTISNGEDVGTSSICLASLKNNLFYRVAAGMEMLSNFAPYTTLDADWNCLYGVVSPNSDGTNLLYATGPLAGQTSFWGRVYPGKTGWFADGRAIGAAGAGANDLIADPRFRATVDNVPINNHMIRDYVGGASLQEMAKIVITATGWDYSAVAVTPTDKTIDAVNYRMRYLFTPTNQVLANLPVDPPVGGSPWFGAFQTPVDSTAPVVSSFGITQPVVGGLQASLAIVAADEVGGSGISGYAVTETASTPTSWSNTLPTAYNFALPFGAKTLYAWAKDGAGNVSEPVSAQITLVESADTIPPVVTGFSIGTPASLSVPVVITATDNVGVTGYAVTESTTQPTTGWQPSGTYTYTAVSSGAKTMYPWAKDAAGNISPLSALTQTVTLTSVDLTPPVVTAFTMPATASSLSVDVTTFTATDEVNVVGYLITTTSATPALNAAWSSSAPAVAIAPASGTVTFYAWAKDSSGNISAAKTATTVITVTDITPPVITNLSVPATASIPLPGGVSVSLAASDSVGVNQYLLSDTLLAGDTVTLATPGWVPVTTTTSLNIVTSYQFSTPGQRTLTLWVADLAGNISTPLSRPITISQIATSIDTQAVIDAVLNTPLVESYPTDGSSPTLVQAIYMLLQLASEKSITGTTMTVNRLDGSTPAMTFELDNATDPKAITRTS